MMRWNQLLAFFALFVFLLTTSAASTTTHQGRRIQTRDSQQEDTAASRDAFQLEDDDDEEEERILLWKEKREMPEKDESLLSPTERANKRRVFVSNEGDGQSTLPVNPFSFLINSSTSIGVVDQDTLLEVLQSALDEQFQMVNYGDDFIKYESVSLTSLTFISRGGRRNLEERHEVLVTVGGGDVLFSTFFAIPSTELINEVVKTAVESDNLFQTIKTPELFPDLISIHYGDSVTPDSTPAPTPHSTPAPTPAPSSISVNNSQQQYTPIDQTSSNNSFVVVISSVVASVGVLAVVTSLYVFMKRRQYKKEWSTDNHNIPPGDFNLASMDCQSAYNTEHHHVDNDSILYDQRKIMDHATTAVPFGKSTSVNTAAAEVSLRDSLYEMTRNIFVNFSSSERSTTASVDSQKRSKRFPKEETFDENIWVNNNNNNNNKTQKKAPGSPSTVSTEEDDDDIESPGSITSNRQRYPIPHLERPLPLTSRTRSVSSTSTKDSDLAPDAAWDPNDNDADSDVASIDAQFQIT